MNVNCCMTILYLGGVIVDCRFWCGGGMIILSMVLGTSETFIKQCNFDSRNVQLVLGYALLSALWFLLEM